MSGELGPHVDPEQAITHTRNVISFVRWGFVILAPFYISIIAALFLLKPEAVDNAGLLPLGSIALAVLLALAAFRLGVRLLIDPTKTLVEQLAAVSSEDIEGSDRVAAGLFVIDAFRENQYRVNLPLGAILSKLDAVRLWRDAVGKV